MAPHRLGLIPGPKSMHDCLTTAPHGFGRPHSLPNLIGKFTQSIILHHFLCPIKKQVGEQGVIHSFHGCFPVVPALLPLQQSIFLFLGEEPSSFPNFNFCCPVLVLAIQVSFPILCIHGFNPNTTTATVTASIADRSQIFIIISIIILLSLVATIIPHFEPIPMLQLFNQHFTTFKSS